MHRPQSIDELISVLNKINGNHEAAIDHKPSVFLCYKNSLKEDDSLAHEIYETLRTDFTIKVDQNLDPQTWATLLQDQIEDANYVNCALI